MRVALALTSILASGCFRSSDPPGTLPGEAIAAVQLDSTRLESTTVDTAGATVTRNGQLTTIRGAVGAFASVTRFGTMSGIEGSFALGNLSGDATQLEPMRESNSYYVDGELGGVIQPFYVAPKKVLIRLAGDFGIGFTRDDRYTYAGLRLGTGSRNRRFAIDASVRRHFGNVPGNDGAYEDRARAIVSIRPGKNKISVWQVGVELIRGDQRTLTSGGSEMGRDDYLLRGTYESIGLVLGYGGGAPHDGSEGDSD